MTADFAESEPAIGGPAYGPWSDPSSRARVATIGLAAVTWVLIVDVLWTVVGIATVGGVIATPSVAWFDHYDVITTIIGRVYIVGLVLAGATFIRWQRTAVRNLPFLGCEHPEHGTGIATFGWFIPIGSLVLPLLSMREITLRSRPPNAGSAGGLLGWWWGLWIASGFVITISSFVFQIDSGPVTWISAAAVDAVGTIGLIACGILAVKIVRTLTTWQHLHREARGGRRSEAEAVLR